MGVFFPVSTIQAKPLAAPRQRLQSMPIQTESTRGVIAWSSLFFALLQSICTFFAALDGLRLVIGVGSLAMSAGVAAALDRFHADWVRIPMIGLALFGSLLNLAVLMQLRRLRSRPASQWRQMPLSPHKIRMERLQLVLSIATLILIGVEEYQHFRWAGHL
jgi:hypothetical protein